MSSDLVVGGAVVGGVIVLLRAIEPFLTRATKNGMRKSAGELDPADWELRMAAVVEKSLASAIDGQNEILKEMADVQRELSRGMVKITALLEVALVKPH